MQEEVTQKTIALSMKTGKLTAQALQAALKKYLQHRAKGPKLHHGKQSLKQLKAHGAALAAAGKVLSWVDAPFGQVLGGRPQSGCAISCATRDA